MRHTTPIGVVGTRHGVRCTVVRKSSVAGPSATQSVTQVQPAKARSAALVHSSCMWDHGQDRSAKKSTAIVIPACLEPATPRSSVSANC